MRFLLAAAAALFAAAPFAAGESLLVGDGLLLDLLWLALLVAAALFVARGGSLGSFRLEIADVAALSFFGLAFSAAARSAFAPPVRPSVTFAAHAAALAAAYLFARLLFSSHARRRAAALVVAAQAVGLAAYGIYQTAVELPRLRAMLAAAADPAALLQAEGVDFVPGTASWTLFQNRLQSPEPFASFALANSLAGFLAPWLAVLLWLAGRAALDFRNAPDGAAPAPGERRVKFVSLAVSTSAAAVVLVCLVLTRSRTAWIALAAGLFGQALLSGIARLRRGSAEGAAPNASPRSAGRFRRGAALAAGVLLIGLAAAWWGGLDRTILSEAGKSLGFRLQYWRGAASVAAEHPLLGCGPGKFGDQYTRFKEPAASEEIQDPHQMFLETAAVAGLPTLLALVAAVFAGIAAAWQNASAAATPLPVDSARGNGDPSSADPAAAAIWIGGAAAGLLGGMVRFAEWSPLSVEGFWWSALAGPLLCLLFSRVAVPPRALAEAAAAGWLVWLVDLQAAGGIFFPGVAVGGWLLFACVVGAGSAPAPEPVKSSASSLDQRKTVAQAAVLAAGALFAASYLLAYQPVQASRAELGRSRLEAGAGPGWEAASAADPWDAEAARGAASSALGFFLTHPHDAAAAARYELARDRFLAKRGENDSALFQAAEWEWARYLALRDRAAAASAAAFGRRALPWYPNSPRRWAVVAQAESAAGLPTAAAAARQALALHALTPHLDKQLPPETLAALQRLAPPAP